MSDDQNGRALHAKATIALVLLALTCCATARLPWTAENLKAVSLKCGLEGLTVETGGIAGGGLHAIGKEPLIVTKYRCLERRIQVPADFIGITG